MKNVDNSKTAFKVTFLEDVRKSNPSLLIGNTYEGKYRQSNNSVIWLDILNQQEWTFWVGSTCELLK